MGKMFKGMCVPICTPFVEGGEAVDEGALKAHIDWLLEGGVHIILACGGTGEFAYLREAERRRVAEITVRHVAGRGQTSSSRPRRSTPPTRSPTRRRPWTWVPTRS